MEVINHINYDIEKSSKRIDDILNSGNGNYSDVNSIPSRSELTYTNGYYVNVTALFIDIVGSSDMAKEHNRPILAKIYRSFISECTAIMNSYSICKEININGDCVWGIFKTSYESDFDSVLNVAAELNSLIRILNCKLQKKNYNTISVGIGIDYGRALMVKAGYSGSGLNDVIWMGDVVNSACHFANYAGRNRNKTIVVSNTLYSYLNDKELLKKARIDSIDCYEGDIIESDMEEWRLKNCT